MRSRRRAEDSFELVIRRQASPSGHPFWLTVRCSLHGERKTVAELLLEINRDPDRRDADGKPFDEICWQSSCLQKKCGACAMVINGTPALACGSFVPDCVRKGRVVLEPLRKFPLIADLLVDRSIVYEDLKIMSVWAEVGADIRIKNETRRKTAYDASRCLECGLCLEVCPNFASGEKFAGAAAFVPAARLLVSMDREQAAALRKAYREHIYSGCAKSLACADICPAHIDMDRMLSSSAAAAVWGTLR